MKAEVSTVQAAELLEKLKFAELRHPILLEAMGRICLLSSERHNSINPKLEREHAAVPIAGESDFIFSAEEKEKVELMLTKDGFKCRYIESWKDRTLLMEPTPELLRALRINFEEIIARIIKWLNAKKTITNKEQLYKVQA